MRPRVLFLIKGLGRGGAEQLLVSAVRYGDHDRFDYEVAYLLPEKDALVPDLRGLGISVHCLHGGRGVSWVWRLRHLVRERRIDLVHVHSPFPAVGARALLPRSIPLVYTEHNVWERYHRLTYWGNLLTYWRNDQVLAVSSHVAASARYPAALRFLPRPPIRVMYHGPDPETLARQSGADGVRREFDVPAGSPIVGTVANLKGHKGYPFLLQAAALVRREQPDVRFLCVGIGPLLEQRRREAAEMGLGDTVTFTGFRDDVPRLMAEFDVFVLASLQEGLSIALIEAMALGRPCVVTRVGGLPEVVEDGRQGLIVSPGDAPGLATAILRLLGDPGLRGRMAAEARRRAADFDIRAAVRRIERVYEGLLQ